MSVQLDPIVNHRLTDREFEVLSAYGEVRDHQVGDMLFAPGDRRIDLCVLISGQLDVYIREADGERRVGWLEPRQFTGDITTITGQGSMATAQMVEPGQVLHVKFADLQRLLVEQSELSDRFVEVFVARRAWARASGRASVILIGRAYDRDSFTLRDLLTKHTVPHLWVDAETDENAALILQKESLDLDDLPSVITGGGEKLVRPSLTEVSAALGLDLLPDNACADVVVVGAGPSGLAASVYAASEGLNVVTLDSIAPGGQAGTSSKIENYLGFPSGVSGADLAERATLQAQKFGARIAAPATAASLDPEEGSYCIRLEDGRSMRARAVILSGGAKYRRLPIDGLEDYEGSGVYYGATAMEAQLCNGASVAIVGAGNSAGQGAVFLSKTAREVHVLYRRADIRETMSDYLVRRLEETPNIHLHPETEISAFHGEDGRLSRVATTRRAADSAEGSLEATFVFMFIGAAPFTNWLPQTLARDEKGFVKTGADISNLELIHAQWTQDRMPSFFETSLPRVYAVGDIRAGSVKRVASGVGEGSVVVQYIHRAIAEAEQASNLQSE